jgi:hypothetical protein
VTSSVSGPSGEAADQHKHKTGADRRRPLNAVGSRSTPFRSVECSLVRYFSQPIWGAVADVPVTSGRKCWTTAPSQWLDLRKCSGNREPRSGPGSRCRSGCRSCSTPRRGASLLPEVGVRPGATWGAPRQFLPDRQLICVRCAPTGTTAGDAERSESGCSTRSVRRLVTAGSCRSRCSEPTMELCLQQPGGVGQGPLAVPGRGAAVPVWLPRACPNSWVQRRIVA